MLNQNVVAVGADAADTLFKCLTCGKVSHAVDLKRASLEVYIGTNDLYYFCTCGSSDLKRLDFEEK